MKNALHHRVIGILDGRLFTAVVVAGLLSAAVWMLALRPRSELVYETKGPGRHLLRIVFERRGINPMGRVSGRIFSGDVMISEMLMADDETNPIPPRVVITRVEWIEDSELLGRCVVETTSKGQSQRFVFGFMNIVPGEFAHFPAGSYFSAPK